MTNLIVGKWRCFHKWRHEQKTLS